MFRLFTLLLLATLCIAKGTIGFGRAMGGGYYRSSKTGYYSRTNRYYVYGMYWRSGYYYSYRGPTFRHTVSSLSQQQLENLFCKRDVRVDTNATEGINYANYLAINSTQKCFIENQATPDHPLNVPVDTLMLSRFRFQLSVDPYPTVDLVVYPDKDISDGLVNNTFRLKSLFLSSDATIATIARTIDFGSLTWKPCTLDECYTPTSSTTVFGQPSSRFVEGSRVLYSSIHANYNNLLQIQIRFWLSNDFDEENDYEHVYLMPNAIKVDVVVTVLDVLGYRYWLTGSNSSTSGLHYGVEALLAAPVSGPGSSIRFMPTPLNRLATEYNPQNQNRLQLGTVTDQSNYKASFLSWSSATSGVHLCYDNTSTAANSPCMTFLAMDPTVLQQSVVCTAGSTLPLYCQNKLLRPGQQAYQLRWIESGDASQIRDRSWYLNFGYLDPAVSTQPDLSSATDRPIIVLLLSILVALLVL